jgi:hypothetical protein
LVSFSISFDISEAVSKLRATNISKTLREELHKGGDLIMTDAKAEVHVISGDLKNSGRVEKHDDRVDGGFTMDYAMIEEKRVGGKYAGPHAYLEPSVKKNGEIIFKNMKEALSREFGK